MGKYLGAAEFVRHTVSQSKEMVIHVDDIVVEYLFISKNQQEENTVGLKRKVQRF